MGWSPPKKITYVLSILFFILGVILVIEVAFGVLSFYSILPLITIFQPTLNSEDVWLIIGLFLMFLAWFLLILGVRIKGI